MSDFIEDFYYGNIEPQECTTELKPKVMKCLNELARKEKRLFDTLTDEDKEIYKAITYKIYPNKTMMIGMLSLPEDLELINSMPKPEVPMLLFISDGKELQMESPESWIQLQKEYVADNEEGTYIELDCGHFMHNIEYKRISEEMKAYIESLD